MIEDKELGIKIAENPIETLWTETIAATENRIKVLQNSLIVEQAFLITCNEQLKKSTEVPLYAN